MPVSEKLALAKFVGPTARACKANATNSGTVLPFSGPSTVNDYVMLPSKVALAFEAPSAASKSEGCGES